VKKDEQEQQLTYEFNEAAIYKTQLCDLDETKLMKVDVFKVGQDGPSWLAFLYFSVEELRAKSTEKSFRFPIGESLSVSNKQKGFLSFKKIEWQKRDTLMDYFYGGCEMKLIMAIDYTGSNGDPKSPQSLHSLDMEKNEYIQAINAVYNGLKFYLTDEQIPLYGFGAALDLGEASTKIATKSNCFAVNGDFF